MFLILPFNNLPPHLGFFCSQTLSQAHSLLVFFFFPVSFANWCAQPQLIHLRGTAPISVNLKCAVLTFTYLAHISVFLRSLQGGQCNMWHVSSSQKAASATASDRFPRTHSSLSALLTSRLVCLVCVCSVSLCVCVCFPHPPWCHR